MSALQQGSAAAPSSVEAAPEVTQAKSGDGASEQERLVAEFEADMRAMREKWTGHWSRRYLEARWEAR